MPQSLSKVYLHIVFSIKYRQNLITEDIETVLFEYIGGICKSLECNPIIVGGYLDHIHILCCLSKENTIANLVKIVKSKSSKWIKTKGKEFQNFYWQNGYAVFSVNPFQLNIVESYIKHQRKHHQQKNYKNEILYFLRKYKIDYDEKYLWD